MAARLLVKRQKLREADDQLEHLEQAARGLFVDVREAILGLKMSGQQEKNLSEALEEYVSEYQRLSGIPTEFSNSSVLDISMINPEVELNIFRIVQEALNNIRKHSHASKVWVNIAKNNDKIQFEIKDDGVGIKSSYLESNLSGKFGLTNMHERAEEISADLQITSVLGEGTQIIITLDVKKLEKEK